MGSRDRRRRDYGEKMLRQTEIALFMPNFAGGGAERVMINLAAGLADQGLEVDLVVARASGPLKNSVSPQVRVIDLGSASTIKSLPALVRYLKENQPKAILSALEHANVVAIWASKLSGIPVRTVVSVHNTLSEDSSRGRLKKRIEPWFVRRNYPKAHAIVAVSQGVANDLATFARVSRESLHVILNPVISTQMLALAQEQPHHSWLNDGGDPVVLGIGRLTEQKNFPLLISAFHELTKTRPARLLILGEGELRPHLERQVRDLKLDHLVSLPGFDANPHAAQRTAAVVALSSHYEGLPTVLIEGLAAGANLVSTDCPHGPREILQDGKLGRLVPPGDAVALAQALSEAIDHPIRSDDSADWHPYRIEVSSAQYRKLLIPNSPATHNQHGDKN